MSSYDIYVFVLCLIVFVMLAGLSTAMIAHIYKLTKKLISVGAEDEKITNEYRKSFTKSKIWDVFDKAVSIVLVVVMFCVFAFSVYMHATEDKNPNGIPSLKVVKSPSMSYAHEDNEYLFKNGIEDRLQTFDIILTHHIPDEYDLELYDVVLYDTDDKTVVHRIVDIEEPNSIHPDCRYFVLQGDANKYPDKIPVYYSQMRGIYRGERVPFVGSFVMFMQSPAGWMCILLIIIGTIAAPVMEKKINEQKRIRLIKIGVIGAPESDSESSNTESN